MHAGNERGDNVLIYQIKLPKQQDAAAFLSFMREEYFPAVHRGPTRVGRVTDLVLLQSEAAEHEFFWHVGWSGLSSGGPRFDAEEVERKFAAFGARVKRSGSYREVAAWHEDGAP